ncbi:hypothetical protein J2X54_001375 [Duganella sp. 3397]|uniref:hypothetical protein n=1 Tax=Duganella sp. 3397 TaxID=2817732 RepID=UPI00285C24F8|nr:hypothetical protein [Duganella sp. 3397]MDR7048927.1 hypothetical protein [Duganella sp. 3397]
MPASHDTYVRRQGLKKTYDIEYTALRYKISLGGKVLKDYRLPLQVGVITDADAVWQKAVTDVEHLRGMRES